jgi:hypothetical protein
MVLRAVRDVLSNMEDPLHDLHAPPVGTPCQTLHRRIVDACQAIRNCPDVSERMRRSMMRRESHGGHFEHLTINVLLTHKLNVSGHVSIWTVSLVVVCGIRAKICRQLSAALCTLPCFLSLAVQPFSPKFRAAARFNVEYPLYLVKDCFLFSLQSECVCL